MIVSFWKETTRREKGGCALLMPPDFSYFWLPTVIQLFDCESLE
jgi:hypothetical protein